MQLDLFGSRPRRKNPGKKKVSAKRARRAAQRALPAGYRLIPAKHGLDGWLLVLPGRSDLDGILVTSKGEALAKARAHQRWVAKNPGKAKKDKKSAPRPKKKRAKKNPLLGTITLAGTANPMKLGQKVKYKDLPPAEQKRARKAAMKAARFHGVPLGEAVGEVVSAPTGTARHVVDVGELVRLQYKTGKRSKRAGWLWDHAAGDHGRGKKKTKASLVTADPSDGHTILCSRKGSRAGFSSDRGLTG